MRLGSASSKVSRVGLLMAGALAAGCSGGLARWEGLPAQEATVSRAAAFAESPPLAAATRTLMAEETRGFGIIAGAAIVPFGGFHSRASGLDPYGVLPGYPEYARLFEDGFGAAASFILRRPEAGTLSLGDMYALATFEFASFAGKTAGYAVVDNMTIVGLWLDAKTMLAPRGATGVLKPYAVFGMGLTFLTADVGFTGTVGWRPLYEAGAMPGLRGKLGVELRRGKMGLYAEIGAQVTVPPKDGDPDTEVGDAGTMIATPAGIGLIINF